MKNKKTEKNDVTTFRAALICQCLFAVKITQQVSPQFTAFFFIDRSLQRPYFLKTCQAPKESTTCFLADSPWERKRCEFYFRANDAPKYIHFNLVVEYKVTSFSTQSNLTSVSISPKLSAPVSFLSSPYLINTVVMFPFTLLVGSGSTLSTLFFYYCCLGAKRCSEILYLPFDAS